MNYLEILIAFISVILLASLLVTILTQMIISVLNLRGKNLFWGLERLFSCLQQGNQKTIKNVTDSILKHPLISRSKKRYAPVIRVEELNNILTNYKSYLNSANLPADANEWLERFKNKKKDLSSWFDNITDRISERFSLHSRLVSITAAVIVTFILQLDSIYLMQKISLDDDLRVQLVANAELYLKEGDKILSEKNIFNLTMDSLLQEQKENKFTSPPVFTSRFHAEGWLKENTPKGISADSLSFRYQQIYNAMQKKKFNQMGSQLSTLNSHLNQLGLGVLTEKYIWPPTEWRFVKMLGMMISIALLSLGAPFWFNALKSLVNLRSRLMETEAKERGERKKESK